MQGWQERVEDREAGRGGVRETGRKGNWFCLLVSSFPCLLVFFFGLVPLMFVSCEVGSLPDSSHPLGYHKIIPLGETFNPDETGTIHGRINWEGAVPQIPPFRVKANPNFEPPWPRGEFEKAFLNPNAPRVDAIGGVAGAVVYLRQVEPKKSRPWDHESVTVTFKNYRLEVCQGKNSFQTGFVRHGDVVTFESLEQRYHVIRGRQADFFTLTLPRPNQPRQRALPKKGIVELSSGADYYWLRGYLFVTDHPYYTRTNSKGEFTLTQVPAGDYELVAWMPNWMEANHEHNPENMSIHRFFFKAPVEQKCQLKVRTEEVTTASFSFRTDLFIKEHTPHSVTSN